MFRRRFRTVRRRSASATRGSRFTCNAAATAIWRLTTKHLWYLKDVLQKSVRVCECVCLELEVQGGWVGAVDGCAGDARAREDQMCIKKKINLEKFRKL